MLWAVAIALLEVAIGGTAARAEESLGSSPQRSSQLPEHRLLEHTLPTAEGGPARLNDLAGTRATVLVFLSTECPISNGYIPTLNTLSAAFADRGVRLIGLNPNDGPTLRDLAAHRKDFRIAFPVLKDAGARVAAEAQVTHCPQVVVLDPEGRVAYRGRIDDRYAKRGGAAADVGRADLERALDELLAGEAVSVPEAPVIGCRIARRPARTEGSGDVTYGNSIAALIGKHCVTCHRTGGIGPFALETCEQVSLWAEDVREFTANRTMPPWLPEDGVGDFHNRRAMSDAEIELIDRWVRAGCPEGDPNSVPPRREFSRDWVYGTPDLIARSEEPFQVPADGKDVYRCFVIPTDFPQDQYVHAVEVRPGNHRVVHHVIVFLDTGTGSTQLDAEDPGPGYSTSAGFPGFLPAGGLGGWAPGNLPRTMPTGVAKVLPAGARLVIQVHYHPSGKPETDQTEVGIYFSKEPVTRVIRVLPLMPLGGPWSGMKIPAGEPDAEVRCSVTLPRDLRALTITPHMHLLGKDMSVTATLPDGTITPLIRLRRWDFNWQESYQYREPVPLPAGTRLDLVAHYDNTSANRANPNTPPKNVYWGENTADEMCIAFLELVPAEEARTPEDLKAPTPLELLREGVMARLKTTPRPRRTRSPSNAAPAAGTAP